MMSMPPCSGVRAPEYFAACKERDEERDEEREGRYHRPCMYLGESLPPPADVGEFPLNPPPAPRAPLGPTDRAGVIELGQGDAYRARELDPDEPPHHAAAPAAAARRKHLRMRGPLLRFLHKPERHCAPHGDGTAQNALGSEAAVDEHRGRVRSGAQALQSEQTRR